MIIWCYNVSAPLSATFTQWSRLWSQTVLNTFSATGQRVGRWVTETVWPFHRWATGKSTCGTATTAGGKENPIYYTGPQSVCLKNSGSLGQEIANQSFCLFCGNCSSKASVSHSCICVRMCASYKLGTDTRRKEAEVTSASLLPAVCPELLRSESSSVCRLVTLNEKKTFKLCCGRFSLEAKWHKLTVADSFTVNTWFMTVVLDFGHKNLKADTHLLRILFGFGGLFGFLTISSN